MNKILGSLDLNCALLRLNCNRKDYEQDYKDYVVTGIASGNIKIFFHEMTHYFQIVTTPIGRYLTLLSDLQNSITEALAIAHPELRPGFTDCYIYNETGDFSENDIDISEKLRLWWSIEIIKALINGNFYRYNLIEKKFDLYNVCIEELFCEIDSLLASKVYGKEIIKRITPEYMRRYDKDTIVVLNTATKSKKPYSIFENQARLSEYYTSQKNLAEIILDIDKDMPEYSAWLKLFAQKINPSQNNIDFSKFYWSFMSICEIAQCSGIFLSSDIGKERYLSDFIPIYRMARLIDVSKNVPPAINREDCNRYINELVTKAEYTPIDTIYAEMSKILRPYTNYWDDLLIDGIKCRQKDAAAFIDFKLWHSDYIKETDDLLVRFLPPVVIFNDYVSYRIDEANVNSLVKALIVINCYSKFLYEIMIKHNDGIVYLPCPLGNITQDERKTILQEINTYIKKQVGSRYGLVDFLMT